MGVEARIGGPNQVLGLPIYVRRRCRRLCRRRRGSPGPVPGRTVLLPPVQGFWEVSTHRSGRPVESKDVRGRRAGESEGLVPSPVTQVDLGSESQGKRTPRRPTRPPESRQRLEAGDTVLDAGPEAKDEKGEADTQRLEDKVAGSGDGKRVPRGRSPGPRIGGETGEAPWKGPGQGVEG